MREKLDKDAKEQGLITVVNQQPQVQEVNGVVLQAPKVTTPILHVTKYASEKAKYDEILSAIGEYFELFKTHTDLLEDLWL